MPICTSPAHVLRKGRKRFIRSNAYLRHGCLAAFALLAAADIAVAGNIILSPALDLQAGYEHNRRVEFENAASSSFMQTRPGVNVNVFGECTETTLKLNGQHTQYAENDFKVRDEAAAVLDERWFRKQDELGIAAGGGFYRDEVLPGDDHTFWQFEPYASRMLMAVPAELNVKGMLRRNYYDTSAYASTSDRVDTRLDVRPGIEWNAGASAVLWAALYAEWNDSSAEEAEYTGVGGALGCNFYAGKRAYSGAWVESGTRPYRLGADDEPRRDTPFRAGGWSSYRLRPWLDLFFSVNWESFDSTQADAEYTWWSAQGGIRMVMEREILRK